MDPEGDFLDRYNLFGQLQARDPAQGFSMESLFFLLENENIPRRTFPGQLILNALS